MHKIDGYGATANNTFTEGNPSTVPPVPATQVTDDWLTAVQSELVAAIEGAGILLDKPNNAQLLAALRKGTGSTFNANLLEGERASDFHDAAQLVGLLVADRLTNSSIPSGKMASGAKVTHGYSGVVTGTITLPTIQVGETKFYWVQSSGTANIELPNAGIPAGSDQYVVSSFSDGIPPTMDPFDYAVGGAQVAVASGFGSLIIYRRMT